MQNPPNQIPSSTQYPLVNKQIAAQRTGLSAETLKRYRLGGLLQKDIHWVAINSRVIRYNIVLVLDWIQNKDTNPQGHINAIECYLESLPSGWKKPRIRRLSNQTDP